ncbi:hypothetical protein P3S67_011670 [Capsicum chacoense]
MGLGFVFVTMVSHEEAKQFLTILKRSKDLLEFFKANGANVVSAEVIFNDNPRQSVGYGFVSFNTKAEPDEGHEALSFFDGKIIMGLTACSDEFQFPFEFMGRAIRVAQSKRFLRAGTKKTIQSQERPSELVSVAEWANIIGLCGRMG